jgi:hypothetical protein
MAYPIYDNIPELSPQAAAIARRRKIAEAMLAQSQEQTPSVQMAGQVVAPVSWTQGLAKLAQAYVGNKQAEDADKAEQGLANKRQQMVADELAKIQGMAQGQAGVEGVEAQPERTIQAPAPMQPNQVAPNYNTVPETVPAVAGKAAVPAVAPNKRQAIMDAMMSNMPEVQKYGAVMQGFDEMDSKSQDKKDAALQAFQDKKELLEMQVREGRISKEQATQQNFENMKVLKQMGLDMQGAIASQTSADRRYMADMASADRRYGVDNRPSRAGEVTPTGEPLTVGQKAVDREFGKEYADYQAAGGSADVEKQLNQLRQVSTELGTKGNDYTGPIRGAIPDFARAATNPEAVNAKNQVEEVVQRNLRAVLGAQFTQVEGERLIARAYNDRLKPEQNKKRVDALTKQIEIAAKTKEDAARYFEQNGTLSGWKGRMPSLSDFDSAIENAGKNTQGGKIKPAGNSDIDKRLEKYK